MKKLNFKKNSTRPIFIYISSALLINLIIELLSRKTIGNFFEYIFHNPLAMLYNSLIILSTLSLTLLFKRRFFVFSIISATWLGFGITNKIILANRVTPFTATDLTLAKLGLEISRAYFTPFEIFLLIISISAVVLSLAYIWIHCPKVKGKINLKKNLSLIAILFIFTIFSSKALIKINVLSDYFGNIAFAYLDYGFPYCFTNTLFNSGIDRPNNYSKKTMTEILETSIKKDTNIKLAYNNTGIDQKDNNSYPNIIMIQLESFFDPTLVKGLNFSEDPIPNFRALKDNFSSGFLNVPSVGAGTANTEFEILTGMSLDFFGPGEYPYKTILKETTCESISYNLKQKNYKTHAIHNNTGTFYSRNRIFSQLGFDTYTSLEYMDNIDENPTGWVKDSGLTTEILKSMKSTKERDFVFTITVQSHGAYPEEEILINPKISVTGLETAEETNAYTYFVNQINEVDAFIKDLIDELSSIDEKTMVIFFGDHLPTLGLEDEDLSNNSIFQTEYVIWNNFNLPVENKDVEAFQLSSLALNKIGITNGILTKYHNNSSEADDYLDKLELLQYDMLYGERYIYDSKTPYFATNIKMGIDEISISNISEDSECFYVEGLNFTPFSSIYLNDEKLDTTYVTDSLLKVEKIPSLNIGDRISVKQTTNSGTVLSSSNEYKYFK